LDDDDDDDSLYDDDDDDLLTRQVLAKWTADASKGDRQQVPIYKNMNDGQDSEFQPSDNIAPGEVHVRIQNTLDDQIDVFWLPEPSKPIMTLPPHNQLTLKTWDTHQFAIYKKGDQQPQKLRDFVADTKRGNQQKLVID